MFGGIYNHIDYFKVENRLIPILFMTKRIVFAYGCFYIKFELINILSIITMLNVSLMLANKPFIDP